MTLDPEKTEDMAVVSIGSEGIRWLVSLGAFPMDCAAL